MQRSRSAFSQTSSTVPRYTSSSYSQANNMFSQYLSRGLSVDFFSIFFVVLPFLLISVLLILFLVLPGRFLIVIPPEHAACTVILGRRRRILSPGVHLLAYPLEQLYPARWRWCVQRRGRDGSVYVDEDRVDAGKGVVRVGPGVMQYDFVPVKVMAKDRVHVEVDGTMMYRITELDKALFGIDDLRSGVEQLLQTLIFEEAHTYTSDKLSHDYHDFSLAVQSRFNSQVSSVWGIECTLFRVQNISLDARLVEANVLIMAQERAARASLLQLEAKEQEIRKQNQLDALARQAEVSARLERGKAESDVAKLVVQAQVELVERLMKVDGCTGEMAVKALCVSMQMKGLKDLVKESKSVTYIPLEAVGIAPWTRLQQG